MSLPVLTSQQVREAEQRWAQAHDNQTWPLMVKAAESFVRQYLQVLKKGRVLIVAGKGNNGGDGYYIGKLLLEAGVPVTLVAPLGDPIDELDAARAQSAFIEAGGDVRLTLPESEFDAIVDALFGSGLIRELTDDIQQLLLTLNASSADIYAVDVPSGLSADTGQPLPLALAAKATHSFIALKPGLLTAEGPSKVGRLTLDDLSVETQSHWVFHQTLDPLPIRVGNTHKALHGNIRVVGGWQNMGGAAVIAARAALNAGAGRVFVHCDAKFFPSVIAQSPELMLGNELPMAETDRAVYVIGPGLGRSEDVTPLLESLLSRQRVSGVLDADALYFLPGILPNLHVSVKNWVLTPHEAEAANLLGVDVQTVAQDRVAAVLALSETYQTTVVLKGAGTMVAHNRRLIFCHPGHPAMSTPGMGDTLAGVIGSLIAQGLAPYEAAVQGVNWHALLGAELARTQRIVTATDIIDRLKDL